MVSAKDIITKSRQIYRDFSHEPIDDHKFSDNLRPNIRTTKRKTSYTDGNINLGSDANEENIVPVINHEMQHAAQHSNSNVDDRELTNLRSKHYTNNGGKKKRLSLIEADAVVAEDNVNSSWYKLASPKQRKHYDDFLTKTSSAKDTQGLIIDGDTYMSKSEKTISKAVELMKRMGYDGSPQDAVSRSSQEMNRKLGEPMAEDIDAKVAYETKRINPKLQVPEERSTHAEKKKEWKSTFRNFEPSIASGKEKEAKQKHDNRRQASKQITETLKSRQITVEEATEYLNTQFPQIIKGAKADEAKYGPMNKPAKGAKEHTFMPFSIAPKKSEEKTKVFPKGTKTEDLVEKSDPEPGSNEYFTGTKEEKDAEKKFDAEEKEMTAKHEDSFQDQATEKKTPKSRKQRSPDEKIPNIRVIKSEDIVDVSQYLLAKIDNASSSYETNLPPATSTNLLATPKIHRKPKPSRRPFYGLPTTDDYGVSNDLNIHMAPAKIQTTHAAFVPNTPSATANGNEANLGFKSRKPQMMIDPYLRVDQEKEQEKRNAQNRKVNDKQRQQDAEEEAFIAREGGVR